MHSPFQDAKNICLGSDCDSRVLFQTISRHNNNDCDSRVLFKTISKHCNYD